jgi:hypothetical protein
MPKLVATQHRPAAKPVAVPNCRPGFGPRKNAKQAEAMKASTNEPPKISAGLPDLTCSSLSPAAACHFFANSSGEYHNPPSTNAATVAASTASQFTSGMS